MSMEQVLTIGMALAPFVTLIVGAIKRWAPEFSKNAEARIALVVGPALAMVCWISGLGQGIHWLAALLGGVSAGMAGQVIHDYAVNPIRGRVR